MNRHAAQAALAALVLAVGLLGGAPPAAAAETVTYVASQDTYAVSSSPGTNFNSANSLGVGAEPTRISYLKFTITRLTEPVTRARLRLHVQDTTNAPSPEGGTVHQVATTWSESTLTYTNRPAPIGGALGSFGKVLRNTWYEMDVTGEITGNSTVAFSISAGNANGAYYDSRESGAFAPRLIVESGMPDSGANVLLAAGDISACSTTGAEQTAQIIDRQPGTVLGGGDLTDSGTAAQLANCFDPTWGRFKDRMWAVLGNHDYITSEAQPSFAYFGAALGPAGKGYYSFNKAGWHIVVLNSNCSHVGGCQAGSPQERWLRADLAANPARCTLAYYHHPMFSSGGRESSNVRPFFQALYDAGTEVILNGHNHQYERFAPQDPAGVADPTRGIREFVVGTGGRPLQSTFPEPAANSEVRNGTTFGVLKFVFSPSSYTWQFLPVAGGTFTDSGSGTCH